MKAFKAWVGHSAEDCIFKLGHTFEEAQRFLREIEQMKSPADSSGICPMDAHECPQCGTLVADNNVDELCGDCAMKEGY